MNLCCIKTSQAVYCISGGSLCHIRFSKPQITLKQCSSTEMFLSKTYFNHELDTDKYNGPFDELWEWDSGNVCSVAPTSGWEGKRRDSIRKGNERICLRSTQLPNPPTIKSYSCLTFLKSARKIIDKLAQLWHFWENAQNLIWVATCTVNNSGKST